MSPVADQLLESALQLPMPERANLVASLIESLDEPSGADEDVEAAWSVEIRRRIDDIEHGRVQTEPWEEVHKELRGRLDERRND